jgi:peptidoglycan/LPS O-acetylase OafA/YrhL
MTKRMTVVDALRGIASLAVILPHSTGFFASFDTPSWLVWLALSVFDFGHCGVDIFFVLSGFVISYSLSGMLITRRFFLNFALRRSIRLDPPYWAAITLMLGYLCVRTLVTGQFDGYPPVMQIIAHLFYLQDILGWGNINAVFWTLCIEIQFYLVLCLSLGLVSSLARRWPRWRPTLYGSIFGSSACVSLASRAGVVDLSLPAGLFLDFWYEFLLGAFVWWYRAKYISAWWIVVFTAMLVVVAFLVRADGHMFAALATAYILLWFSWRDQLFSGLSMPGLQYFGRISYSLYLVHVPVLLLFMGIRTRLDADSEFIGFALFGIAVIVSVVVAHCMHLLIERPSAAWAKKLKFVPATNCSLIENNVVAKHVDAGNAERSVLLGKEVT